MCNQNHSKDVNLAFVALIRSSKSKLHQAIFDFDDFTSNQKSGQSEPGFELISIDEFIDYGIDESENS